MSDFDLPALEMEARLKDFISQNLETINGKIQEFGDKATEHFERAGEASNAFTEKLDELGRKIIGLFAAEKAFSFIKQGVDQFQAGALASAKLTQAIGFQSTALEKMAEADAKSTLYKKDQIISGEANLAFYIKSEAELKELVPTMEDLAVKTGSLDSAATLIGRTFNSNTTQMRGLGIAVTGAAGSHERLDSIIKGLNERFGGQAKALSDSQGEYGQLTKNIEDISKAIGGELIPVLNFWSQKFLELKDSWQWILSHGDTEKQVEALNKQNAEISKTLQQVSRLKTIRDELAANPYAVVPVEELKSLGVSNLEIQKRIDLLQKLAVMESKGTTTTHTTKEVSYNTEVYDEDKEGGDTKEPNEGFTSGVVDTGAAEMKAEIKKSEEIEKILKERVEANEKNDEDIERQNERATIEQTEADKKYYEEVKEGNDKLIEEYQQHIKKIAEVADSLGATFGNEIGKGLASGKMNMKQAMKDVLDQIVEFIEKEELAAIASNTLQNVWTYGYWGIAIGAAEAAGIMALGEAAKGAINSFSAGTSNAPGGFARVHQDETIFLPAHSVVNTKTESKNIDNSGDMHFHFYGNTDSTTVDTIQSMLIEANRTGRLDQFKAKLK